VSVTLPAFADVVAAAARIGPHIVRTPVMRSDAFDARSGRRVFFKCENLQTGGAFKFRGAMNVVLQLDPQRTPLVITHSSGNHGNALALAARARGFRAIVVVPRDSARPKIENIKAAGARLELCEPGLPARERRVAEILANEPAELVHPFDDERIIAGQGTAALELLDEAGPLDALVVPVGGGGLIAGSAIAATGVRPGIRVVGVEPEAGDDTRRSLAAGQRVTIPVPRTIADGQAAPIPGELTFSINRRLVDEIVLVTDDEIRAGLRFAVDRLKQVLEPSGATGLAALLAGRLRPAPARIGVIISGGNVGAARLAELLS